MEFFKKNIFHYHNTKKRHGLSILISEGLSSPKTPTSNAQKESTQHLFFECPISAEISQRVLNLLQIPRRAGGLMVELQAFGVSITQSIQANLHNVFF